MCAPATGGCARATCGVAGAGAAGGPRAAHKSDIGNEMPCGRAFNVALWPLAVRVV